jgi:hypothetical protein
MRKRTQPPKEWRTAHGALVSIWRHLALRTKGAGKSRARLEAYLAGETFLTAFQALDPARRWLALEAVRDAMGRFLPAPAAPVAGRVRWTPEWQERVRAAAARLPDDASIGRALGLSTNVARMGRWRYAGPRREKAHIAQIAA